jgi:signal transduction histidine kinase/ActR/RegA family two-component response regulator/sensor domain CHASE-containing protein
MAWARHITSFSAVYLALTFAYTCSGKLALLLAVPPGYASPVFPPAGIAVAAMLISGWASLPWTFLGSLLLNIWSGYSPDGSEEVRLAAALVIAAASTLQAAVGGTALRHAIGYPAALDNVRDITRFFLLSPIFCLISSTLSLAGLSALGVVARFDLLLNWVSWWLGDTLGVLLVLPLVLVIAGEPHDLWRRRRLPLALPMLLLFALFVAIFVRVNRWEHDETLSEFRLVSEQAVDKIRTALTEQEVFLRQLERSFTLPGGLSPADFQHLVQNLLQRFSLIQAVEWAPRVTSAMRARFEEAKRAEMTEFEIREMDPSGHLRRAEDRAEYYPVTFLEQLRGNEQVVGFDLASEANRRAALEAAIKTGKVAATAPIRLVQENEEQPGILLFFPVLGGSMGPGVLLVVHRTGKSLDGMFGPFSSTIGARLTDLDANQVLYDSLPPRSDAIYKDVFTFGGRTYGIAAAPTRDYLERHRQWQSWAVLAAGIISTGLLGALLLLGTGYTRRIETVVEERTGELETINRRLHFEIEERQQAEAALRQAQRMEAIGQLTGGIAHDFNNLLMVVNGNAALLSENAPNETIRRRALAIQQAADRGERLTRQLLAFSRRRALRVEPVDIRQRRSEIIEMLSRSLRDDIELIVEIAEGVWPIMVDPTEFELALLNIGVNARDAMRGGGRLFVEARNCSFSTGDTASEPLIGDFVALKLSDTGTGMTAEVRTRAFEPFFTTKEVGRGSGLGLSQVYGFAQQSGGAAVLDSEIDKGTTITLYLPRATASPTAIEAGVVEDAAITLSVRVLLVEDDLEVQNVATELLYSVGCQVVRAGDGGSALAALERDPAIELLISDLAMPGDMSGLELARIVRQRYPGVPILLSTGYSQYAAQAVREGFKLIEKPLRRDEFVASIWAAVRSTGAGVRQS